MDALLIDVANRRPAPHYMFMDDNIIFRWTRGKFGQPDWTGHYAQRPVPSVLPSWVSFAEVDKTLAGWTLSAVYLQVYDSLDFSRLKDAKEAARTGLLQHMKGYQDRVVREVGARRNTSGKVT